MCPQKHSISDVELNTQEHTLSAAPNEALGWYCVQTLPKHEHIAAAQLRQQCQLDVFLPRIRYQRSTRNGPAWVTEALFTGYVFSRFSLAAHLRWVQSARGVREVVHFGQKWPVVPDGTIEELREAFGPEELKFCFSDFTPGDAVEIAEGAFSGLQAIVSRVLPSRERVAVLIEFLGRQTAVEVNRWNLVANRS